MVLIEGLDHLDAAALEREKRLLGKRLEEFTVFISLRSSPSVQTQAWNVVRYASRWCTAARQQLQHYTKSVCFAQWS